MRTKCEEGKKNYKNKFYVSQHVKVDLSKCGYIPKQRITTDGKGVIQSIHGRFLRTPKMAEIVYTVRFDNGHLCGDEIWRCRGEKLCEV